MRRNQSVDQKPDPYAELRQTLANTFRPPQPIWSSEPRRSGPHVWPWVYGDAYGTFPPNGPGNMLDYDRTVKRQSSSGGSRVILMADPAADRRGGRNTTRSHVPLNQASRRRSIDAALHFCLADTFHPGCEMTWPMRHFSIYQQIVPDPSPTRTREPETTTGEPLIGRPHCKVDGPLIRQESGDITRWMALPWQGDTAFCRSGYDLEYDPYVPTFWAARVPNQVLTEEDYQTVIDTVASTRKTNCRPTIGVPAVAAGDRWRSRRGCHDAHDCSLRRNGALWKLAPEWRMIPIFLRPCSSRALGASHAESRTQRG